MMTKTVTMSYSGYGGLWGVCGATFIMFRQRLISAAGGREWTGRPEGFLQVQARSDSFRLWGCECECQHLPDSSGSAEELPWACLSRSHALAIACRNDSQRSRVESSRRWLTRERGSRYAVPRPCPPARSQGGQGEGAPRPATPDVPLRPVKRRRLNC
jgi:hypothetical protein